MTTKGLMTINATLLAAIIVAAVGYVFSGRSEPRAGAPAATRSTQKPLRDGFRSDAPVVKDEPTERLLTDAQWQRLQASDSELQRHEESAHEEVVVVSTPVAFLEPDPALVLDADQIQAISAVRQSFNDAMRAAGDPSSLEYSERWQAEQNRVDELLIAYLGAENFSKFHEPRR